MTITASKLYDYIQCSHKVWRDAHGPQEEKIKEANPFVEMLWEKGVAHEKEVIKELGEITDLSQGEIDERFEKTLRAIEDGKTLIYQGVLKYQDELGIPDLLQKTPDERYVPIDIKSGRGFEGADELGKEDGKPKKHYAVQLCFYIELLEKLGIPNTKTGKIIDIDKNDVSYDLDQPMGKKTPMNWWEFYNQTKNNVQVLLANEDQNKPAISGKCKLCSWYDSCKKWAKESQDLTNLFYVGASQRDVINQELGVQKVIEATDLDIEELLAQKKKDKNFLRGVGKDTLKKLVRRATILTKTKQPVLYKELNLPQVSHELFFDIEDDPTQGFVYMHGVYERTAGEERFLDFTAKEKTKEAEKQAWADFWQYIKSLPKNDFAVYYYSHHEKTTYRKMQKQYPDVVSAEEVEEFFSNSNVLDLYSVVSKYTDWPLGSYSLKDIAQFLGFQWEDETPSGALSIQWFNDYLKIKDESILQRILIYNKDDCKATMVLKDELVRLDKLR